MRRDAGRVSQAVNQLEEENASLKKLLADVEHENAMLKELAEGNF